MTNHTNPNRRALRNIAWGIIIAMILWGAYTAATASEPSHTLHFKAIPTTAPHATCTSDYDCQGPASLDPTTNPMPTGPCQEDDPCWDCPTMGNRSCGPDAPAWMKDGDPTTGVAAD